MKKLLMGLMVLVVLVSIPLAAMAATTDSDTVPVAGTVQTGILCQADDTAAPEGGWNLVFSDAGNTQEWGDVYVQSNHQWSISTSTEWASGFPHDGFLTHATYGELEEKLNILIATWPDSTNLNGYNTADAYTTGTIATLGDLSSSYTLRQMLLGEDRENTEYTTTLIFSCENVIT